MGGLFGAVVLNERERKSEPDVGEDGLAGNSSSVSMCKDEKKGTSTATTSGHDSRADLSLTGLVTSKPDNRNKHIFGLIKAKHHI